MDKEEGALTDALIRHNRQTAKAFRMIVDKVCIIYILFIIITQHSPFSMLKNFTVMKKAVRLYHLMMWTKFLKVSQVLNLVRLLIKQ